MLDRHPNLYVDTAARVPENESTFDAVSGSKFAPVIVTGVPGGPMSGENPVTTGGLAAAASFACRATPPSAKLENGVHHGVTFWR